MTAVDLHLLQNALNVVTGVELAVSRSAIPIYTPMYVRVYPHIQYVVLVAYSYVSIRVYPVCRVLCSYWLIDL